VGAQVNKAEMESRVDALIADLDALLDEHDADRRSERVLALCVDYRSAEMLSALVRLRASSRRR